MTEGRVAAIVLAAGAASRFGSDKLQAELHGRPLLAHALLAVAAVPIDDILIVADQERAAFARDTADRLRIDATVVTNADPARGISSSIQAGLAAARDLPGEAVDSVAIVLGDQPVLDPEVVRRLLATAATSDRAIVAPLYSADSGRNPVVIGRAAWPLIEQLSGDRGLGPIMDATPELVAWVPVTGRNPDVDEPADLAAVASASPGSFRADRPADASADRSTEPA